MKTARKPNRSQRRGATLVLIALLMVFLIGMVAFAVEVGRMFLVRSQLQSAVDAGALAAALELKKDPKAVDQAAATARQFVQYNRVGWLATVPDSSIIVEPGAWDAEARVFTATTESPNAVRVAASQDGEPFLFARVFGRTEFGVPASAIAAGGATPLDIGLVLDLSGSMESSGRIEALQTAAPEFINVLLDGGSNDQVAVFGFGAELGEYDPEEEGHSGVPYVNTPQSLYPDDDPWVGVMEADMTDDLSSLKSSALSSGQLIAGKYNGWTPTGAAIRDAAHYVYNGPNARSDIDKAIVLMSDGKANKPPGNGEGYALQMAAYAKSLDIKIYTISLGDGADTDLMNSIAVATDGQHFDATGAGEDELSQKLTDAFKQAALSLKKSVLVE